MPIIARNITKSFTNPPTKVLHGITLEIKDGEFVSIVGKSGSGKTTLLYILSTLDAPTEGILNIGDLDPQKLGEKDVHLFRNKNIGYVFQFHYLLPELTVLENVLLPARKARLHEAKRQEALDLIKEFGLEDKIDRYPGQLSGGEQQRVAIARALLMNPRYIFADEPTGNLDSTNGQVVMKLFRRVNKEKGATIILVTHESEYAAMADRQIFLADGRVVQSEND
jgi:ABC-type lipoprotein export system ATPase subunit